MTMSKIVVAMSGGVDSSVAAALLKEQGYEVIGVTLRLSDWQETEGRSFGGPPAARLAFGGCCGSKDFFDARAVAQTLDIPHYAFDYVEPFRQSVITYFTESYQAGETPNPCIACNQFVKFDRLLDQARALGADYLATGHYARIESRPKSKVQSPKSATLDFGPWTLDYALKKAIDPSKDQSYVLYHLGQEQLSRLMFPLGDYAKTEVREIARRYGLATAEKPDSQEICFVPNGDHRVFLQEALAPEARRPGPIRHRDGSVLGEHRGLPFYTIGQREGLGVVVGRPLYVVGLERASNTLVVGEKTDIYSKTAAVRAVSWVSGQPPDLPLKAAVKIRYKHTEATASLQPYSPSPLAGEGEDGGAQNKGHHPPPYSSPTRGEEKLLVIFHDPQAAVTPGQAAVFYDGDTVLGGGVIDHVLY